MKVTSFNPIIGTANLEEALEFYNGLGFKPIHHFQQDNVEFYTLENEAGLRVDILKSNYIVEQGYDGIFSLRVNVNDLDEAIAYFESKGAVAISPRIKEGESRELVNYRTTNGDIYCLIEHLKH